MRIKRYLIVPGKLSYVRGKKPEVNCILCALRDDDKRVTSLLVTKSEHMIVTLNLYPYSTGHLLIFPKRHLTDIRQFSTEEVLDLFRLQKLSMKALEDIYQPTGFNTGFNVGTTSGASIEHIHCHVIPRHEKEMDILELISSDSRVTVEDQWITLRKLQAAFVELGEKITGETH
jgi:ATP adenylyltransferase